MSSGTAVTSWGRLSFEPHRIVHLEGPITNDNLANQLKNGGVAHGSGRSYGDACLNPLGTLWVTTGLDHFLEFDTNKGLLTCEAGVLLGDIQQLAVSFGWMLEVTPGTQFVTVGGAIANDVHGKNHHARGCFGDHVKSLTLIRTDGNVIQCGPDDSAEWFAATVGGLGLTGLITKATLQLRPVESEFINVDTLPYQTLEEYFHLVEESCGRWEYTVAWIDCITKRRGRGLFMRGNHSQVRDDSGILPRKNLTMPFTPPFSPFNQWSVKAFNTAYFHLKKIQTPGRNYHFKRFFYPLDNLQDWNRAYGPKGFFQHQSLFSPEVGYDAIQAMIGEVASFGEGSFLAVLKSFGNRIPNGFLSFPKYGFTLSLDFPNRGDRTRILFDRLDAIVREAEGRLYLAKDACMSRALFEASYPNFAEFWKYRDPGISSSISRRLMED